MSLSGHRDKLKGSLHFFDKAEIILWAENAAMLVRWKNDEAVVTS